MRTKAASDWDPREMIQTIEEIQSENKELCRSETGKHVHVLDMALGISGSLVWSTHARELANTPTIWGDILRQEEKPSPTTVFQVLMVNLFNSIFASRGLILAGLENQARCICRQVVEIGDVALVATSSKGFYRKLLVDFDDRQEKYQHWKTNLAPKRVRTLLDVAANELVIDASLAQQLQEERESVYGWLSESAHISWTSLACAAYAADFRGVHNICLGGRVGQGTLGTLTHLNSYLVSSLILLHWILVSKHEWKKNETPTEDCIQEDVKKIALAWGEIVSE